MARKHRAPRYFARVVVTFITLALVAAMTPVGIQSPAAAAGTTYIDETFDSSTWDRSNPPWHNWIAGYISRSSTPGILNNGTRITMKKGTHWGAGLNSNLSGSPDEGYFRYWMRFETVPEETGKLPGFMGLYTNSARGNNPPSENQNDRGWSARVLFGPDGSNKVRLGYYTYHLDQEQSSGDGMWWSQKAQIGEWVCVEGRVKMNTGGGNNGTLQAWLNSQEVFNRTDLRFRTAVQTDVHVKQFMFEVYYGGSSTAPRDTSVSFDGLVVADQRVGCEIGGSSFTDVQESPFITNIEWLAEQGITKGCNPTANTRFCPTATVTRGQMAAFLHRALDAHLSVSDPPPPPAHAPQMWGVDSQDYKNALIKMEQATGDPIDMVLVRYDLDTYNWLGSTVQDPPSWAPTQLTKIDNAGSVPYIEFFDNNISAFNSGSHDAEFNGWLDTITGWLDGDSSRRVLIIPFPDANNKNEDYGDHIGNFQTAYRKVHDAVRARGIGPDQARFVYQMSAKLDSNRYTFGSIGNGFGAFSPGDSYIDIAAVSWTNTGSPTWDDWDSILGDRVAEMNAEIGGHVPVLLSLVASVSSAGGNSRADWFDNLAAGINSSSNAIGFVYYDRSSYAVGSSSSPNADFVDFVGDISSPSNQLAWVFDGSMDTWKADMAASSSTGQFIDDDGSIFEQDIAWLARSGVTKGCNPPSNTRFCPDSVVTRGQMAAFLHRALDGLIDDSGSANAFTDVGNSPFATDIAWLARTGITKGCNPPSNTRFCPDSKVTRGQMAAFLHRALANL